MEKDLDLSGLVAAVKALERGLAFYGKREREQAPDEEREVLRGGVIQAFEFTYELCWKLMKRWLELNIESVAGLPRREFYRVCAENLLLDDVGEWMEFHKNRNSAAHTYNEDMAEEVTAAARRFLPYAQDCLKRLEERS